MPALAVIIVSWNTRDLLHRCVESVHASLRGSDIDYSIVVVDNASTDGTPAMLRDVHPEALLIESGRNLGFAGGNNLALRLLLDRRSWNREPLAENKEQSLPLSAAKGTKPALPLDKLGNRQAEGDKETEDKETSHNTLYATPDYVLLLNPDAEVVGDAIPQLVRYLEAHLDVAVVGPKLLYPDGSAQPSRRRFPTKATFFWESTPLEACWPANPWARRYRCADAPDGAEQEVGWLVGAALLVRRTAIERAGLLDAGFHMYSEELEWQRRIRAMNDERRTMKTRELEDTSSFIVPPSSFPNRIVYLPNAVIVHHEGKSSAQAPARRYLDFQHSRLRDARMTYGVRFAAVLRLFLRVAYAFELAVEGGKWLLGHRRALRTERIRVYWQVVCGL
jgi:N-acetylglucosaminyl-diphospho-decaprenol L-rhamnosyltransferase